MTTREAIAWGLAFGGWAIVIDFTMLPRFGIYNYPHEECEMMYETPEDISECLWLKENS